MIKSTTMSKAVVAILANSVAQAAAVDSGLTQHKSRVTEYLVGKSKPKKKKSARKGGRP